MRFIVTSPFNGIGKASCSRLCSFSGSLVAPRQSFCNLTTSVIVHRPSTARRHPAVVLARSKSIYSGNREQYSRHLTSTSGTASALPHKVRGRQLSLHGSSGSLVAAATCVFAVLIAASWLIQVQDTQRISAQSRSEARMADSAAQPGHLGNLTPEQDVKLRELWKRVLEICGVDYDPSSLPGNESGVVAEQESASAQTSGGSRPPQGGESDKHGLTAQYKELLDNAEPEYIRLALWDIIKHDHPDALLLRFLRARKWDVDKALIMLMSALNWRSRTMSVDEDIMKNGEGGAISSEQGEDKVLRELGHGFMTQCRMGKSFLHGVDKEGRPICVVRVRLHRASDQSAASLERYTVYIIETARLALKDSVDTANIIFDMTDFRLANMDYHPVKFMIQCFEANYPESLGVVLVHNAPWIFQGIWKIIRGWLDPVVASKVHFTNHRAGLERFIDPSQLIEELGGDEQWEYKYIEPIAGENHNMEDTETRDQLSLKRKELYRQFEANTSRWMANLDDDKGQDIAAERDAIALKLKEVYWNIDPYIRARSLYDRQDVIRPGGDVDWYRFK